MNHIEDFRTYVLSPFKEQILPLQKEIIRHYPTGSGVDVSWLQKRINAQLDFYHTSSPNNIYNMYENGLQYAFDKYKSHVSKNSAEQFDRFMSLVKNHANGLEPLRSELIGLSENYWSNNIGHELPGIVTKTIKLMTGAFGLDDLASMFTESTYRKEKNAFQKELMFESKIFEINNQTWLAFNQWIAPSLERDFYG